MNIKDMLFRLKMRNVGHGDNFTMTLDNKRFFIVDTGEQKDITSGYVKYSAINDRVIHTLNA